MGTGWSHTRSSHASQGICLPCSGVQALGQRRSRQLCILLGFLLHVHLLLCIWKMHPEHLCSCCLWALLQNQLSKLRLSGQRLIWTYSALQDGFGGDCEVGGWCCPRNGAEQRSSPASVVPEGGRAAPRSGGLPGADSAEAMAPSEPKDSKARAGPGRSSWELGPKVPRAPAQLHE